jgi:hypothetical protein
MVRMLDPSRELCGPCSGHWGIASLHFSSESQGCFMRTHTIGVCVIIYERPTTDHVVEATTPRWMFEGGMRETVREPLALL